MYNVHILYWNDMIHTWEIVYTSPACHNLPTAIDTRRELWEGGGYGDPVIRDPRRGSDWENERGDVRVIIRTA